MTIAATTFQNIPELQALWNANRYIRIPPGVDVPLTPRIAKLIDTAAFRRLANISQLGLVSLVYPGATHSRFEHSLGVYRNALLFMQRLIQQPEFRESCTPKDCETLIVAALLHDVGHVPYAHVIEDLKLSHVERHEVRAAKFLKQTEIAKILADDFAIQAADVLEILNSKSSRYKLISSLLNGPIDIDKLDYLSRDSLHAGVPYGNNFDQSRLISQLCVDVENKKLALTEKAKTAAEMMVFARYVMFSEVYWHPTVRSATAMLQRCIFMLPSQMSFFDDMENYSDAQFVLSLYDQLPSACEDLFNCLFGPQRVLYKCVAQFDFLENQKIHSLLARRSYSELLAISVQLRKSLSQQLKFEVGEHDILIDAPPPKLEVQFDVRMRKKDGRFRALGDVSPVIQTLALQQFDNLVKRVRVFVHPRLKEQLKNIDFAAVLSSVES